MTCTKCKFALTETVPDFDGVKTMYRCDNPKCPLYGDVTMVISPSLESTQDCKYGEKADGSGGIQLCVN